MDFETPQFITDALRKRLEHSLYGYTIVPRNYWQTIVKWIEDHHQWRVDEQWMRFIPGIVKGIGFVINVFVKEDEKVIIQPPVYHPFRLTPEGNRRQVVYNPLRENADGSYSMDFDNLAEVADEKCRLLILSNPHNPAGITWDTETLRRLADFCSEHNIIVISDEIHSDMAIFGNKHVPFASVSDAAAECSITFGAPSKTFNIAGIVSSWCIVPNEKLRQPLFDWMAANELDEPHLFAVVEVQVVEVHRVGAVFDWMAANELDEPHLFAPIATMAAFNEGEEWRQQMLAYVEQNILFVEDFLSKHLPQIKAVRPQASFLVWLDCRGLHLDHDALIDLFVNRARLALNDGEMFGKEGRGFMRMNVATPRSVLKEALERLVLAAS